MPYTISTKIKKVLKSGIIIKIFYLLLALLSFNSLTANRTELTYLSLALTVFGAVLFIYRLFHYGAYIRTKGLFFLTLFLLSYAISSVYTMRYGILGNIKAFIWMAMQFYLLYAYDSRQSRRQIKHECCILSCIFIIYTFIFSALGIGCVILNYSKISFVNGERNIIGYIWNRLWGFYSDPNYGALFAIISMLLSIFFTYAFKKKIIKIFSIINCIIQLAYIACSDSRTALVAAVVSLFCLTVIFAGKIKPFVKLRTGVKAVAVGITAIIMAALPVLTTAGILEAGNQYLAAVTDPDSALFYWMDPEKRIEYYETHQNMTDINAEEDDNNLIGRPLEDLGSEGGDISNRRFAIWRSSLDIVRTSPVLGVSFRNIVPYTQDRLPQTYIVNNDQGNFESMHCMFVDILVSQGTAGLIIFLIFAITAFISVFRGLFKKDKSDYMLKGAMLCILIPIIISALFFSEILYVNTGGSVIFWIVLGYLMNLTEKKPDTKGNAAGILTFHNARNYGACLQALALQEKIGALGKKSVIINYNPKYIEDSFGLIVPDLFKKRSPGLVSLIKLCISTVLHLPWRIVREAKFRIFADKNYNLTDDTYLNQTDLRKGISASGYDTLIFGSDQVWNNQITHGFDGVFFGEGLPQNSCKASYAASLGAADTSGEQGNILAEKLKYIDYIAVREENARTRLSSLTDRDIAVTIDPTFLLEAHEWEALCKPVYIRGDYICVYVLEINDEITAFVRKLAEKEKLPVVTFDLKNRYGCKVYSKYTADPLEFISYIRNAKYVITNSFHGTVFSIIFKKQFVSVPNRAARGRSEQLLCDIGLEDRLIEDDLDISVIDRPIAFDKAFQIIEQRRSESLKYLNTVLKNSNPERLYE